MYLYAMRSTQVRNAQRAMHLIAGVALVAYVYLTPSPGSVATLLVRVLVPVVVLTGIGMWQWPRIRNVLRSRGVRV